MAANDCKDCVDTDCADGACVLGGKSGGNAEGTGCMFGIVALIGVASLLCAIGCSTANSAQPAKSQTQNNTFDDCVIVVATKCSISNRVIRADGTKDVPAVELFTMAQSQESSGSTESFSPTSTQTPTTDVKPDLNVHYNDAMKNATDASKNVLSSIVESGRDAVLAMMAAKQSGTVTVKKTDGTNAVVECKDGQCSFCTDGACEIPSAAK